MQGLHVVPQEGGPHFKSSEIQAVARLGEHLPALDMKLVPF